MNLLGSILVDGIAYSMVLFLISIGLAMTLGLMHFTNMAHGAFALFAGLIAATMMRSAEMSFFPAAIVGIVAVTCLSVPLEVFLVRRFYHRSPMEQMLVTIGLMFIAIASANVLFGSTVTPLPLPHWLAGSTDLGFKSIATHRLAVILLGLATLGVLWFAIDRSKFGIYVRASVDNAPIAQAIGINTKLVYIVSFMIGAGLAGMGGIMGAELLPLEANYPGRYLVILLAVVAIGGHGTLAGSFLASLMLGLTSTAAKYLIPELSSIAFFVMMFIALVFRPHGIMGRH